MDTLPDTPQTAPKHVQIASRFRLFCLLKVGPKVTTINILQQQVTMAILPKRAVICNYMLVGRVYCSQRVDLVRVAAVCLVRICLEDICGLRELPRLAKSPK